MHPRTDRENSRAIIGAHGRAPYAAPARPRRGRQAALRGAALSALLALLLGGCVSVSGNDPTVRSLGVAIDDQLIESRALRAIELADPVLVDAQIAVTSFNGRVLLTGQVPNEALRATAGKAARTVREVRDVFNELSITGPMSIPARANDTWLTSKVKSALVASDETSGLNIKVVTRDGIVYLMGLTTRSEGTSAARIASEVYGAQKVVSLFEYVD